MNLIERLREESQDDPDSLYWKAAERIAELENAVACGDAGYNLLLKKYEKAEARLDAVNQWLNDEWTLTEQQRQGCLKALEQKDGQD